MIRWKVVQNRRSYPGNLWSCLYTKDTVVKSKHLGIFVFKTKYQAENYRNRYLIRDIFLDVIKVDTLGRGKALTCCPTRLRDIGKFKDKIPKMPAVTSTAQIGIRKTTSVVDVWMCAPGTMTYPAVKVLT